MYKVIYLVKSEIEGNPLEVDFEFLEDAIEFAKEHAEDKAYVEGIEIEVNDFGETVGVGEHEILWSNKEEAAEVPADELISKEELGLEVKAPVEEKKDEIETISVPEVSKEEIISAEPIEAPIEKAELEVEPAPSIFFDFDVDFPDYEGVAAKEIIKAPADFMNELAAELGIADQVEVVPAEEVAAEPVAEPIAVEEPAVVVEVPAEEVKSAEEAPVEEAPAVEEAPVEVVAEEPKSVEAVIAVEVPAEVVEKLPEAEVKVEVPVEEVKEEPVVAESEAITECECKEEAVCPECGKAPCECEKTESLEYIVDQDLADIRVKPEETKLGDAPVEPIVDEQEMRKHEKCIEEIEDTVECGWCGEKLPVEDCKKEKDLGYLCPQCEAAIKSRGETLVFEEAFEPHLDIESEQKLEGTDNAVVPCEVATVIAHSEDEKPLDCKMEKAPLEEPLAEPLKEAVEEPIEEVSVEAPIEEPIDNLEDEDGIGANGDGDEGAVEEAPVAEEPEVKEGLPVEAEKTVADLIIDEKEAIEGYTAAITELAENPEISEETVETLKHISDEELEHVEELASIVKDNVVEEAAPVEEEPIAESIDKLAEINTMLDEWAKEDAKIEGKPLSVKEFILAGKKINLILSPADYDKYLDYFYEYAEDMTEEEFVEALGKALVAKKAAK